MSPIFEFTRRSLGLAAALSCPIIALGYIDTAATNWLSDRIWEIGWLEVLAPLWVLGVIAAAVWARRGWPDRAHDVLEGVVRAFLVLVYAQYAYAKFVRTQFFDPYLAWQATPSGDLTGFQLVWTFYGSSFPHAVFLGLAELGGAVLLLFDRTRTLGALVLFGVGANLVVINAEYEVGVLLFAAVYLVMAGYLLLADWPRVSGFFLRGEAVGAASLPLAGLTGSWRVVRVVVSVALLAIPAIGPLRVAAENPLVDHPLVGIWEVSEWDFDLPAESWEWVSVERRVGMGWMSRNGTNANSSVEIDTLSSTLSLKVWSEPETDTAFVGTFVREDGERLRLEGRFYGVEGEIELKRRSSGR